VNELYGYMTDPERPVGPAAPVPEPGPVPLSLALPPASLGRICDLLELVPEQEGISLAELADELVLELDDLLPIIDAGELLALMEVDDAHLRLTAEGRTLLAADEEGQQDLLRRQLLAHVPLAAELQRALEASSRGEVDGDRVLDRLSEEYTRTEAEAMFDTFVSWVRSCGLFRYSREQDRFRSATAEAEEEGGA
jgi:NitT/TauT family transport system ATP-binding protein